MSDIEDLFKRMRDRDSLIRKDCYYFIEDQDFHARVCNCALEDKYGSCPCESCDRYIAQEKVDAYINNHIEEIRNS